MKMMEIVKVKSVGYFKTDKQIVKIETLPCEECGSTMQETRVKVTLTGEPSKIVCLSCLAKIKVLKPFASLDILHLRDRPDSWIVFAINDSWIKLGDIRRVKALLRKVSK
jgi:hypothetical protein